MNALASLAVYMSKTAAPLPMRGYQSTPGDAIIDRMYQRTRQGSPLDRHIGGIRGVPTLAERNAQRYEYGIDPVQDNPLPADWGRSPAGTGYADNYAKLSQGMSDELAAQRSGLGRSGAWSPQDAAMAGYRNKAPQAAQAPKPPQAPMQPRRLGRQLMTGKANRNPDFGRQRQQSAEASAMLNGMQEVSMAEAAKGGSGIVFRGGKAFRPGQATAAGWANDDARDYAAGPVTPKA